MDILIKVIQLFLCFTLLVGIHELGHFLMARVFGIRVEKVLHLLRSVVLALQVQARRHGVRRGLAAAGRLRQDRRHDRRKSRYGADEAARPARRVPRQTGVAAFSGDDRRHRDEHPAGRGHLLRHLLHVGRKNISPTKTPSTATPSTRRHRGSASRTATKSSRSTESRSTT